MSTGMKLAIGLVVLAGATAYMAYLGASSSWQYYVTAEECLANADAMVGSRLRVSGRVAPDSLRLSADRSRAEFRLAAAEGSLPVVCSGPLPDNLAENVDVVVEGQLEPDGLLRGHKVLTRCASKYEAEDGERAAADPSGPTEESA
jgi:cytochrome c-type biogenesis protein CcmE